MLSFDVSLILASNASFLVSRMTINRVPVTNVCRFVAQDDSDFEMPDSSGDDWLPGHEASNDDEEVRSQKKTRSQKINQSK